MHPVAYLLLAYVTMRVLRAILPRSDIGQTAVIVTGASSGFGRAIAERMHQLGCIVFAGCEDAAAVDALVADLKETALEDGRFRPLKLDVTKESDVLDALKAVVDSKVPLRAVINNAGISAFGWAEVLPVERHARNVDVNYLGTVRMTRAFLPTLRASKGRIVNVGSIGARMPSAFGSSYLPAKAAMLSYSECVRQEVFRHGVRVSYIEPGFFETALRASASANGASHSAAATTAPTDAAAAIEGRGDQRVLAYPGFEEHMKKTAEQIKAAEYLNGGAKGVGAVVDAVVDAVCSRIPLCRYTVGYDALLMRYVLCWLPDRLFDVIQTYF